MDWLYPLSGFVVGALVGLTGMGGGSLMTPLLILLFGAHPLTAVGTDLLFAATTKTAGTATHSKNGNVDWRVAELLAAGSVPATVGCANVAAASPIPNISFGRKPASASPLGRAHRSGKRPALT